MTTRSEAPLNWGAAPLGGGDNDMAAALAAFRESAHTAVTTHALDTVDVAAALGNYEARRAEARQELDALLALAATVQDPEVRNEIYAAHDAARMSLAQGASADLAMQAVRAIRESAPNANTLRRVSDMGDEDQARLARYIAEQERYILRLNEQARDLMAQLDPYISDETRADVAAAEAALANAETPEEELKAQGALMAAQRRAAEEVREHPEAPEAAQTAADALETNTRERVSASINAQAAVLRQEDPTLSEQEAIEQARDDIDALMGNKTLADDLANNRLSEEQIAAAVRPDRNVTLVGLQPSDNTVPGEVDAGRIERAAQEARDGLVSSVTTDNARVSLNDVSQPVITAETIDTERDEVSTLRQAF